MNHIQSAIDHLIAWCGQPLSTIEFYFKTIDQASLNGLLQIKKQPAKNVLCM